MRDHIYKTGFRIQTLNFPLTGILFMVSMNVYGQNADSDEESRLFSIIPRVTIAETITDNVGLVSENKQADLITEISPGVRIVGEGSRIKAYFDYALSGIAYAQNSRPRRSQNSLSTFGTIEAVDNWMYLDFSGSISQQSISAFGTQSTENTAINPNRTETSSYKISPFLRGNFFDLVNYEARYSRAVTDSDTNEVSGVSTSDGVLSFSGNSALKNLGWLTDFSRQKIDYSTGRPTEADRLNVGLSYAVSPQFLVFANTGRESNNYTSLNKRTYNTHSMGGTWLPTERTRVSASRSRRSFGETHSLTFEHRTALTVWSYTDSQDISATPNQTGFLINSIHSGTPVISGFLSSAVSLQRRQDLSLTLQGVRDTLTLVAASSESRRLDSVSTGVDDLSTSVVRQWGWSANGVHRLTPDYSLGLLVSQQKAIGASSMRDATLNAVNMNLTGRVSNRTTASIGARYSAFSGASPYHEFAISINLTVQF